MKRIFAFCLLIFIVSLLPAAAQEISLADWIPADFAGFVRIDMSDAANTLQFLNNGMVVAAVLQPTRVTLEDRLTFDDFFPLGVLDVEDASFETAILPWLGDEIFIAYRNLPSNYRAAAEDVLVILPTDSSFGATNTLSSVIQGQDFLEQTTYRGISIYQGDRISIALTPVAILVGSDEVIRAALDVEAGEEAALTSDATYQAVRSAISDDTEVFAYLNGNSAAEGLGYVISGDGDAAPLLAALGDAFADLQRVETVEAALLRGEIDGVGIGLQLETIISGIATAKVVLHTTDNLVESSSDFDPAILEFIPRSALMVQSGTDGQKAAYASLAALPMANFSSLMLGGFPISLATGAASDQLEPPTAEEMATAVNGFADALEEANGISVFDDVLNHFDGSYSIALLPRPNNPLPLLNTTFDALLVAQVDDGDALMENLDSVLETLVGEDYLETETLNDHTFTTLTVPGSDEPLLRIGVVDNLLLVGTGDSTEMALNAQRGDNRLINQARWQALSSDTSPDFYLDVPAFYDTFLPTAGGQIGGVLNQIGIHSRSLGDGLYELNLQVTLPTS
jgi:hypothetical protein